MIRLKAKAECIRMADNPKAAKAVWTKAPEIMPNTDIIPAVFPWDIHLPKMYRVSLPGVIFSRSPDNKKTM
ncbi:hypothetical protein D3C75_1352360 [compost metagenome]